MNIASSGWEPLPDTPLNLMNLRLTTVIILLLTFAGLSLVLSATTRTVLISHFEDLEEQSVRLNLQRAASLMAQETQSLSSVVQLLAALPMAAQPPIQPDPALGLDLVVLFDSHGSPLEAWNRAGADAPAALERLAPGAGLLPDGAYSQPFQGVVFLEGQALLLASRPLNTEGSETARLLVAGRVLDTQALNRLGGILHLPLEVAAYAAPDPGQIKPLPAGSESGPQAYLEVLDEAGIAGYIVLTGENNEPAALLRIEQARLFYQSGQRVLSLISIALVTVAVVFAAITSLFLELMVFSRLSKLKKEVNQIRISQFLNLRVTPTRQDELASLGRDINAMLDALELAQMHRIEAQTELSTRVTDLETLNSTTVLLLGQLEAPNTQEMVCRLAVEKFGADLAWIGTANRERAVIQPAAAFGCRLAQLAPLQRSGAGTPPDPAFTALDSGKYALNESPVQCAGMLLQTQVAFPLAGESRHARDLPGISANNAVLNIYNRAGRISSEHLQILEAFANLASVALQNALLFQQVRGGRKRLEMLSRRLVELQEEERKHIAMELHDEIGQILTGLSLMLGAGLDSYTEQQRSRIENARKLVNELIGQVRQLSLRLRPAMLDDLGLLPTLLWYFENYTRQTGIQVEFRHDSLDGKRYKPEIETALYRVTQEALTNIARHAGVQQARVQVWLAEGILNLQILDEGSGFDVEKVKQTFKTFGLLGMQERAIALSGTLVIDSQLGRGSTLLMQLPVEGGLERRNHGRNHLESR